MTISLPTLPSNPLQEGYKIVRLAGAAGQGQVTGELWRGKEFGAVRLGVATEGPGQRGLGKRSRICQAVEG